MIDANKRVESIFRDYEPNEALRSDRSAGDRARHRHKVKQAIKDNLSDIISEESIIGQSRDKKIKIPIRGIKEWQFVYGNNSGASQGDGNTEEGQVVGKAGDGSGDGKGVASNAPGEDIYETEVTLEELISLLYEDLSLPMDTKKKMKEIEVEIHRKRSGYRRKGIRVRLDAKKTIVEKIKRSQRNTDTFSTCTHSSFHTNALGTQVCDSCGGTVAAFGVIPKEVIFRKSDIRYKHYTTEKKKESNAVIFFIMDTSGSMDTEKKYLARSVLFLLYQVIRSKYVSIKMVFIAHDSEAYEVDEEHFFNKGESGGTLISSGLLKAQEIMKDRYDTSLWNTYVFFVSDGDSFSDNDKIVEVLTDFDKEANLVAYFEVKPDHSYGGTLLTHLEPLMDKFKVITCQTIREKGQVWDSIKEVLAKER